MIDGEDQDLEYLKPAEVARILRVSPKTVTRWAVEGRIPCIVTLGGHHRFRRQDVMAVAARMTGQEPPTSR